MDWRGEYAVICGNARRSGPLFARRKVGGRLPLISARTPRSSAPSRPTLGSKDHCHSTWLVSRWKTTIRADAFKDLPGNHVIQSPAATLSIFKVAFSNSRPFEVQPNGARHKALQDGNLVSLLPFFLLVLKGKLKNSWTYEFLSYFSLSNLARRKSWHLRYKYLGFLPRVILNP